MAGRNTTLKLAMTLALFGLSCTDKAPGTEPSLETASGGDQSNAASSEPPTSEPQTDSDSGSGAEPGEASGGTSSDLDSGAGPQTSSSGGGDAGTAEPEPDASDQGAAAGSGTDAAGSGTDAAGSGTDVGGSGTAGASGSSVPDPGADRPYSNVTAVATSGSEGAYTFNVSVESADIDCTQYTDWWEVLGEDGSLVYRRILTHSHTDENGTSDADAPGNTFTRSGGPVEVAADEVVIVRAHMSNEGYNGMVMSGTVDTGFEPAPDIGSDFAADVETEDPQPDGCAF